MVKLIICVKRRPDLNIEQFHDYWRTHHGGLYRTLPWVQKYVRKYTQCHTVPKAYAKNAAPFDGVAELWFDNFEAIDAFLADPAYLAEIRPDEHKFCDFDSMVWFVTEEEPILGEK